MFGCPGDNSCAAVRSLHARRRRARCPFETAVPPGMRQRRGPEGSRLCCVCVVVVVAPPAPGPRASSWGNCSIRGATRRRHADRMLLMVQNPPPRRAERHAGLPRHEECSVLPPALDGVDGLRAQVGQCGVGVDQAGGQAGSLEARGDVLPVHEVPPGLDVVGLDVEVVQVEGVLPHVIW